VSASSHANRLLFITLTLYASFAPLRKIRVQFISNPVTFNRPFLRVYFVILEVSLEAKPIMEVAA